MPRKTNAQKTADMIYINAANARRHAEFSAAGVAEYGKWCRTVEQALALKANGVDAEVYARDWRVWDVTKYDLLTPEMIGRFIREGKTPTDVKRDMSRTYPSPMRTR